MPGGPKFEPLPGRVDDNIRALIEHFHATSPTDLFWQIARGRHDLAALGQPTVKNGHLVLPRVKRKEDERTLEEVVGEMRGQTNSTLSIGDDLHKIEYKLSPCCNPIPGDDVFGFVSTGKGLIIHRTNCPNAARLLANYGHRVVKTKWAKNKEISFLTGLRIIGLDDVGVIHKITNLISGELKVNISAMTIEAKDGVFEGNVRVFVHDKEELDNLVNQLLALPGIERVDRYDTE